MRGSPKTGLYICHCGLNIAAVVDPEALAAQAQGLPGVAVCRTHLYTCSEAGQKEIQKDIAAHRLDRVVVAACSPRLHETTFRRLLLDSGLNPYLLEMVNLREQCSWVHVQEPDAALIKALELIRMGLAKVGFARPLADRRVPLYREALVVGGGPAGLKASLDIADAGFPVTLVERGPVLGGMALRLGRTFPGGQSSLALTNPMMARAELHPRLRVLTAGEVTAVSGHFGDYQVTVRQELPRVSEACDLCGLCVAACPVGMSRGETASKAIYLPSRRAFPARYVVDREHCNGCGLCAAACPRQAIDLEGAGETEHRLRVGAMVVATGFHPFDPAGSRYEPWAALPGVVTTLDLEGLLAKEGPLTLPGARKEPRDLAFVLCVGSREEEGNRYCSRVCCPTVLKQALELKARLPGARIRIYYRDLRAIKPAWEDLYARAREAGILFLRGRVTKVAAARGRVAIFGENELFGRPSEDRVDLAVLAVGMVPGGGAGLKEVLKLPVGPDGFFLEAHPKLRPLETVLDGIFLAGACQGPKDLEDSLTQAGGAAAKVMSLFAHDTITLDGLGCEVDRDRCDGCGLCLKDCPFQAVVLEGRGKKRKARITPAACKGCGGCAGGCPRHAIVAQGFTDEMLYAQVDEALAQDPGSKIVAFCCHWCAYAGADFAGVSRLQYPAGVRIIRTRCTGRVHPDFILHAFARGAGQVLIAGCHPPGDCHYVSGNLKTEERVKRLRPKLAKRGIDPARLRLEWISATEGKTFQSVLQEMAGALDTGEAVRGAGK